MSKVRVNLDVIDVEEPCPESWDKMTGDDKARFCGSCRMNVYDLSAMSRAAAEALLEEREGRVCIRFYRRADGTVTTADCAPIRFANLRRAARRTMTGAAALFVALLGLITSLGLFRLSGVDVGSWFEDSVIGDIAKKGKAWAEPEPIVLEPVVVEPVVTRPEVEEPRIRRMMGAYMPRVDEPRHGPHIGLPSD